MNDQKFLNNLSNWGVGVDVLDRSADAHAPSFEQRRK